MAESGVDVDSLLNKIEIYAATLPIFADDESETAVLMDRDGDIYHAEVPTETAENIGGIRIYRDGIFIGGTSVLMKQSMPVGVLIYFSTNGDILSAEFRHMNLKKWADVAIITEYALSCDPFHYNRPEDATLYQQGWQAVSEYMAHEGWPKFLNMTLQDCEMPEEAAEWLTNNLKCRFAYQCILPYKLNAMQLAGVEVDEPPMAAYSFLDSIDYRPEVLLKYNTMLPVRYLFEAILAYPEGGLDKIGETPVNQWQEKADRKLAPAMKSRPQFLLDMLAAMSYIKQIENFVALTDRQKSNISNGLPADLGRIVLKFNKERSARANNQSRLLDYVDKPFDIKSHLDVGFPGVPVVVDFWNTWCSPCLQAISVTDEVRKDFSDSGIAFVYVSDESSPEAAWRKKATEIGGNQLRISSAEMSKLFEQYGLNGFPSYLFFDADHNVVKAYTSFPGIKIYRDELDRISE